MEQQKTDLSGLIQRVNDTQADEFLIPTNVTIEDIISATIKLFKRAGFPLMTREGEIAENFDPRTLSLLRQNLELVRGKKFKIHTHEFLGTWNVRSARRHQEADASNGNAVILLIWSARHMSEGHFCCIANENSNLFCDSEKPEDTNDPYHLSAAEYFRDEHWHIPPPEIGCTAQSLRAFYLEKIWRRNYESNVKLVSFHEIAA
jgi:hypothetical protein